MQDPPLCVSAGESKPNKSPFLRGHHRRLGWVVRLHLCRRRDHGLARVAHRIGASVTFGETGEDPSKQNLTGTEFLDRSVSSDLLSGGALWLAAATVHNRIAGLELLDNLESSFPRLSAFAPWNRRPEEHPFEAVSSNEPGPESLPLEDRHHRPV